MVGAEEEQQLKNRSPRQPLFTVTWSADFVTHRKDGSKRDWLTSVLVNSIRTSVFASCPHCQNRFVGFIPQFVGS